MQPKIDLMIRRSHIEKGNFLIRTISSVIKFLLLLAVVSITCYYYYTRDWI